MSETFSPLAEQFAACMQRLQPNAPTSVLVLIKQVCEAVAEGHVCLDVGAEIEAVPQVVGTPGAYTPLILDGTRLYLARYWRYETRLAHNLQQRAVYCEDVDLPKLRRDLDRLFAHNAQQPDWQKVAAAAAVLRRFCVISGGPGTGKTSTVIRLLAALQSQADGGLRIGLAAPTGKAAARMQDAVRTAKLSLDCDPLILASIPETAFTLHRLLGSRPDSVYFRHNADNPLPLDVLVVDEASMIDLALMSKLLEALPATSRLILLGDKDQLSAVEAGAVFGDICAAEGYSSTFCGLLAEIGIHISNAVELSGAEPQPSLRSPSGKAAAKRANSGFPEGRGEGDLKQEIKLILSPHPNLLPEGEGTQRLNSTIMGVGQNSLGDSIHLLHHSHRFAQDSGIGVLARLCNEGRAEAALAQLEQGGEGVVWRPGHYQQNQDALLSRIAQGYAEYFTAVDKADPLAAFTAFNRFRLLTAHREGDCGAETLNRLMEESIKARLNLHYRTVWYPGRAVMIARNDYNLRLFNGDIGIALEREGQLRVYFAEADGRVRDLALGRLPEHQPVYAMTVHKSQGSEFEQVLLVLPDSASPVLNRPLIYTAITRAKITAEIWGLAEVLQQAIMRVPVLSSGLRDRLLTA